MDMAATRAVLTCPRDVPELPLWDSLRSAPTSRARKRDHAERTAFIFSLFDLGLNH